MNGIPTCSYCGEPVDPYSYETFHKVTGWEQYRRQGGANKITLRELLPEWMHEKCMQLHRSGVNANQGSLL